MNTQLFTCLFLTAVISISHIECQQICPNLPSITFAAIRAANQQSPTQYFVVGGMFDIHQKGTDAYSCSTNVLEPGLLNMLAFLWGVDRYQNQQFASQGISVGAVAFDNCMRPDQTIQNMYDYATCRINVQGMEKTNLVAYVGPYSNQDAERSGALAADLGITVFSPMADSTNLNVVNQKSLLKLRPSFDFDLQALAAFLSNVNAKFVIVLYSGSDPYWKAAYMRLIELLNASRMVVPCVQYSADFDSEKNIYDTLKDRISVKYLVPLMSYNSLNMLMSTMRDSKISGYTFILTSRIGRNSELLSSQSSIANNTLIVDLAEPSSDELDELDEFSRFLTTLENTTVAGIYNNGASKKWISEYRTSSGYRTPIVGRNTNLASPVQNSLRATLLSVRSIMKGMDTVFNGCKGSTGTYQFCQDSRSLNSRKDVLYNNTKAALGINMDNSGDLKYSQIAYTYFVFSVNNSGIGNTFIPVGTFKVNDTGSGVATISVSLMNTAVFSYSFGESSCPLSQGTCCEVTTTMVPTTTMAVTSTAGFTGPTTTSAYSLVMYPKDQEITGYFANDARADSEYGTRFDLDQKWIIALGVLAGLGILCVIVFEIYILYKLLGTPEGSKWRTMWLGQLLLFGIFLCYLVLFAYLPIPTKATCGITRFGVGVAYSFCFAVLLVKLMVILTSKPSKDEELIIPAPNYLKGTYQILMFVFAIGVQIVIDVQWLITVPPEAVKVVSNNGQAVWICNHFTWRAGNMTSANHMTGFVRSEFENHLMSLIYIMVMILITTLLALKSHGIITNHRESIFIGIAAGFTIPIWVAWGLVGGLNRNHAYAQEFGDACIAFGLLITATVILFSMFLPKVRHLVNMGIEGIYLEDDQESSIILAPPSYKGSMPISHISQGVYADPIIINGDPSATYLRHPGSVYSVPVHPYSRYPDSQFGGSTKVLRVTDDLRGTLPQKKAQSEVGYGTSKRPPSNKGTLKRSRSQTNLGAL